MSHPASCSDPNCRLTYVEHLASISISAEALPTRKVNRTEGHPDEPITQTITREKRWNRDLASYRRLHAEGLRPPRVDGSAVRERHAETRYDVEERPVTIDYSDPT